MDYKSEPEPKKKFTREDFKKDVKEAVQDAKEKKPQKKRGSKSKKNGYESWSVSELRKKLNDKKKRCW